MDRGHQKDPATFAVAKSRVFEVVPLNDDRNRFADEHAADEDETLAATIVVFDAERSCAVRLERQTAPHEATRLIALETLDRLGEP